MIVLDRQKPTTLPYLMKMNFRKQPVAVALMGVDAAIRRDVFVECGRWWAEILEIYFDLFHLEII